MKNKKIVLCSAFAVALGLAVITISPTNASDHDHEHMDVEMNMEYKATMDDTMRMEVKAAVEANDYTLLSEEAMEKISEEEFTDMVEKQIKTQEYMQTIEDAVSNNDYDAFVAGVEAHHNDMEGDDEDGKMMMEAMTEEEKETMMKEHYDMLVTYYDENGELPSMMEMMQHAHPGMMKKWKDMIKWESKEEMTDEMKAMHAEKKAEYEAMTDEEKIAMQSEKKDEMKDKMKTEKWEMKKERKYFKESHRGIVKNVVQSVNHERLEKALARIEATLEVSTDETVIDLLEGIKEVIMETMSS